MRAANSRLSRTHLFPLEIILKSPTGWRLVKANTQDERGGAMGSIAGISGQVRRPEEEGKVVNPQGERGESQLFFWKLFPGAKLLVITRVTKRLSVEVLEGSQESPQKCAHQITKETFRSQVLLPYLLFKGLFSCSNPEKPLFFCGGSPFLHCSADPLHWVCVGSSGSGFYPCVSLHVIAPSADWAGSASSFWGYQPHTMLWAGEQWMSFSFHCQELWDCF